jgi:hypothetical protein
METPTPISIPARLRSRLSEIARFAMLFLWMVLLALAAVLWIWPAPPDDPGLAVANIAFTLGEERTGRLPDDRWCPGFIDDHNRLVI